MPQTFVSAPKQLLFDKTELLGAYYMRGKAGFRSFCERFTVCVDDDCFGFLQAEYFGETLPPLTLINDAAL